MEMILIERYTINVVISFDFFLQTYERLI